MSWLQVLTKEPVNITEPPKQKKKKRNYGFMPTSFRLPPEEREWLKANGGTQWLREQINKAMKCG